MRGTLSESNQRKKSVVFLCVFTIDKEQISRYNQIVIYYDINFRIEHNTEFIAKP
jgi:hypothetical protein